MQRPMVQIVVLGAGNIGTRIAEGILASRITNKKIILTRQSGEFSEEEKEKFECQTNNQEAVSTSDIVITAVQPKQMDSLLAEIKDALVESKHLLISVASGVSIERIEALVGKIAIARAMPNTAIRVRQSMTCLAFNELGREHQALVESIFGAVGMTLLIPENRFAEATVLCGSGTALALKFIRAYMQAGIQHGFNEKDALTIASQVLKGASMIVQKDFNHPEHEIDKVTTPGGCTIDALIEMEHSGFSSALLKAIEAGIKRARKLYS